MFEYNPFLLATFFLTFASSHYLLLDLVPEHFQRLRDNLSGEFGSFAAFGKSLI
jgi:hypothetical protein